MSFGWINIIGAIIVILILAPNIIYAVKNRGKERSENNIPLYLTILEQIGRYSCIILMWLPVMVGKFGFGSVEAMIAYFLINLLLILAYYFFWIRYVRNKSMKNAMALAIIPCMIFVISGLLLRHGLLFAAAIIFGISHIIITYITHSKQI